MTDAVGTRTFTYRDDPGTDPEGGWPQDWAEVWTDTGACQPLPESHPLTARRREIDERVLAGLLRFNHQRAAG